LGGVQSNRRLKMITLLSLACCDGAAQAEDVLYPTPGSWVLVYT
jgi:hypothetical protein